MPKIILEKVDIEKLINEKYNGCEIVSGLNDDIEIIIRMEELITIPKKKVAPPIQQAPPKKQVVLPDGSIDANASGLTLEPRKHPTQNGAMGNQRGGLPTF